MSTRDQSYRDALTSDAPFLRLHALMKEYLSLGVEREELLSDMEGFRISLRQADDEAGEDVVLEVMDALVGWISPGWKL
jgi:hypothetical protein